MAISDEAPPPRSIKINDHLGVVNSQMGGDIFIIQAKDPISDALRTIVMTDEELLAIVAFRGLKGSI